MQASYFKSFKFILPIFLILLVFGVYFRVLYADFVYDDLTYIVNNKKIQSFDSFSKFFTDPNIFTGSREGVGGKNWRPAASLAFASEYFFFGANPLGFHLISILLHLLNIILVYLLIAKLTGRFGVSLAVTLLWALHPTLTEAVSWVSNQSSLIFLSFFLLAVLILLNLYSAPNKKLWIWVSCAFFGLSLLSKETALGGLLIVPLIPLFYVEGERKTNFLKSLYVVTPFVLTAIIYFVIRYRIVGLLGGHNFRGSFWQNLLLAPTVFYKYVGLTFWPVNLLLDYSNFPIPTSLGDPWVIAGLGLLGLLAAIVFISFRKSWHCLGFGAVWFFAFLAPVLHIIPFQDIVGERFLYAPLIGFFLALVLAFDNFLVFFKSRLNFDLRWLAVAAIMPVILWFSLLTFNRNGDWLNSENLWLSVIKIDSLNPKAYVNLTAYYLGIGDADKLVEYSERYLKIDSHNKIIRLHLSLGHIMQGKFKEAKAELLALLQDYPDYKPALNNLSQLYGDSARLNKSPFIESIVNAPSVEGNIVNSGIIGRVVLPDGKPFAAMLDIFKSGDMSKPFISVIANEDGAIQIPLKPGSYVIKPLDPDGPHAPTQDSYEIDIGSGQWVNIKIEYK